MSRLSVDGNIPENKGVSSVNVYFNPGSYARKTYQSSIRFGEEPQKTEETKQPAKPLPRTKEELLQRLKEKGVTPEALAEEGHAQLWLIGGIGKYLRFKIYSPTMESTDSIKAWLKKKLEPEFQVDEVFNKNPEDYCCGRGCYSCLITQPSLQKTWEG